MNEGVFRQGAQACPVDAFAGVRDRVRIVRSVVARSAVWETLGEFALQHVPEASAVNTSTVST
jgi:hypothetical protein